MATWKRVITTSDDGNYKNTNVTVSDLGGGSGSTFLKKDGTWATPTDTNTNQLTTFTVSATTDTTATTISQGDDLMFAAGTGISCETTADGTVTITNSSPNTDVDVSVANLKAKLAGGFASNAVTIGDSDDTVTIGNDLVVTGDLTVSGDTTTVNTATLTVEDKLIKLADVASPTETTADGAGIQVETSGTEAEWPELKWNKTGNLTGWTLADHRASANQDVPVSVMQFGTADPTGVPGSAAGTLFADTTGSKLWIYI